MAIRVSKSRGKVRVGDKGEGGEAEVPPPLKPHPAHHRVAQSPGDLVCLKWRLASHFSSGCWQSGTPYGRPMRSCVVLSCSLGVRPRLVSLRDPVVRSRGSRILSGQAEKAVSRSLSRPGAEVGHAGGTLEGKEVTRAEKAGAVLPSSGWGQASAPYQARGRASVEPGFWWHLSPQR